GWSTRVEGGGEWLLSCHHKAEPPTVDTFALNQQVCNTSTTDIHPFPSPSSSWEYSGFTASGERAAREILLVMSRWDCAYSRQLLGKNQRKPNLLSFSKGPRAAHHHSAVPSCVPQACCCSQGETIHTNHRGAPRKSGTAAQTHTESCSFHWGKESSHPPLLLCWDTPLLLKQGETPGSAPGTQLQRQRGAG
ncbi:hypothetical protein Nmel_015015, partial [Mimus melanotis]